MTNAGELQWLSIKIAHVVKSIDSVYIKRDLHYKKTKLFHLSLSNFKHLNTQLPFQDPT